MRFRGPSASSSPIASVSTTASERLAQKACERENQRRTKEQEVHLRAKVEDTARNGQNHTDKNDRSENASKRRGECVRNATVDVSGFPRPATPPPRHPAPAPESPIKRGLQFMYSLMTGFGSGSAMDVGEDNDLGTCKDETQPQATPTPSRKWTWPGAFSGMSVDSDSEGPSSPSPASSSSKDADVDMNVDCDADASMEENANANTNEDRDADMADLSSSSSSPSPSVPCPPTPLPICDYCVKGIPHFSSSCSNIALHSVHFRRTKTPSFPSSTPGSSTSSSTNPSYDSFSSSASSFCGTSPSPDPRSSSSPSAYTSASSPLKPHRDISRKRLSYLSKDELLIVNPHPDCITAGCEFARAPHGRIVSFHKCEKSPEQRERERCEKEEKEHQMREEEEERRLQDQEEKRRQRERWSEIYRQQQAAAEREKKIAAAARRREKEEERKRKEREKKWEERRKEREKELVSLLTETIKESQRAYAEARSRARRKAETEAEAEAEARTRPEPHTQAQSTSQYQAGAQSHLGTEAGTGAGFFTSRTSYSFIPGLREETSPKKPSTQSKPTKPVSPTGLGEKTSKPARECAQPHHPYAERGGTDSTKWGRYTNTNPTPDEDEYDMFDTNPGCFSSTPSGSGSKAKAKANTSNTDSYRRYTSSWDDLSSHWGPADSASTSSSKPSSFSSFKYAPESKPRLPYSQSRFRVPEKVWEARKAPEPHRDPFLAHYESYQSSWKSIASLQDFSPLTFTKISWPLVKAPRVPSEITPEAVKEFMFTCYSKGLPPPSFSSSAPSSTSLPFLPLKKEDMTKKERVTFAKSEFRNWHPDKFTTRVLARIQDERERERVRKAADVVQKCLSALLVEG